MYTSRQQTTGTKPMTIQEVLDNPETSYWLRDALIALSKRDPVDALNDVDVLKETLEAALTEKLHSHLKMLTNQ